MSASIHGRVVQVATYIHVRTSPNRNLLLRSFVFARHVRRALSEHIIHQQKGRMQQFPAVGHVYEANFNDGMILVHLDFAPDGSRMTFNDAGSNMPGMKPSETVTYTAVEVRPQVYLVYWQEQDKMTVVHLEDFEQGIIRTHITAPTGEFYQFAGTLKQIR